MKDKSPLGRNEAQKLVTPEMREQIIQVKEQLQEFVGELASLCDRLHVINEAIFLAHGMADCLLEDDPFEAWDVIKKKRGGGPSGDWNIEE